MTDGVVKVDRAYLSETAQNLSDLSSDLETICTAVRGLDGLVVGAAPVFDEIHEFGEAWSRTAESLSEDAARAADYVRLVMSTFEKIDFEMAEQLLRELRANR